jgi:hypothetical protein
LELDFRASLFFTLIGVRIYFGRVPVVDGKSAAK